MLLVLLVLLVLAQSREGTSDVQDSGWRADSSAGSSRQ